jgi:hypothetical protein
VGKIAGKASIMARPQGDFAHAVRGHATLPPQRPFLDPHECRESRHAATVKNARLNAAAACSAAGESAPPNSPGPAGSIVPGAPTTMAPRRAIRIVATRKVHAADRDAELMRRNRILHGDRGQRGRRPEPRADEKQQRLERPHGHPLGPERE